MQHCDVIGLQMQPPKDVDPELRRSNSQAFSSSLQEISYSDVQKCAQFEIKQIYLHFFI